MMSSSLLPPLFAAIVWWFSTGAVLYLVGLPPRYNAWRIAGAVALALGAVYGLTVSSADVSVGGAYVAFSSTILLWGAQEVAFLAGWVTGPRAQPCPANSVGWPRLSFALQAILYHELMLLGSGALVLALNWNTPNQVALWTFCALWVLRQSAKLNLFLGVPVLNDEMMPSSVAFLKSFFARRPVSAFFPISVTLAIASLVWLILRAADPGSTPFDFAGAALVATLMALGILEHWFMIVPLPVLALWRWGTHETPASECEGEPAADVLVSKSTECVMLAPAAAPSPAALHDPVQGTDQNARSDTRNETRADARQRLEERFRQSFYDQHKQVSLANARSGICVDPATTANGGRAS